MADAFDYTQPWRVAGKTLDLWDAPDYAPDDVASAQANSDGFRAQCDYLRDHQKGASGSRTIRIPAGVTNLKAPTSPDQGYGVTLNTDLGNYNDLVIQGEGPGVSILREPFPRTNDQLDRHGTFADGDGNGILQIAGSSGMVENVTIKGVSFEDHSAVGLYETDYNDNWSGEGLFKLTESGFGFTVRNLRFEHCSFKSRNRVHMSLGARVEGLYVHNCTFYGPGEEGIYFAGDTRDAHVTACNFLGDYFDITGTPYHVKSRRKGQWPVRQPARRYFVPLASGGYYRTARQARLVYGRPGQRFVEVGRQRHYPLTPGLALRGTRDVTISGCSIRGYNFVGVATRSDGFPNYDTIVQGNTFGPFPKGAAPVSLGKSVRCKVADNIFRGHVSNAITAQFDSEDVTISDNDLYGGGAGIAVFQLVYRPKNVSILNNTISESVSCISCDDIDGFLDVRGNNCERGTYDGSVGYQMYGTRTNVRFEGNRARNYLNSINTQVRQMNCRLE